MRAVALAQVDVVAARLRHHGRKVPPASARRTGSPGRTGSTDPGSAARSVSASACDGAGGQKIVRIAYFGLKNTPEPIVPPTTIDAAENSPSTGLSFSIVSGDPALGCMTHSITTNQPLRNAAPFARLRCHADECKDQSHRRDAANCHWNQHGAAGPPGAGVMGIGQTDDGQDNARQPGDIVPTARNQVHQGAVAGRISNDAVCRFQALIGSSQQCEHRVIDRAA